MKYLLFFILLLPSATYAQVATIKEIKFKADSAYYNVDDTTIIYPVIVLKNSTIAKLINAEIRDELGFESNVNLKAAIKERLDEGLTDISYKVTFNKNGLLSLTVYTEESQGHIVTNYDYFNFDLRSGNKITINDIIDSSKINSFTSKVFRSKVAFLEEYKKIGLNKDLQKKIIDSADYNSIIGQVGANCVNSIQLTDFSLEKNNLQIIDPCYINMAMRAVAPEYELKYTYQSIYSFLNPAFRQRLK